MKKIIILMSLLVMLCGCTNSEITSKDVAKAISDISSDNEGNVTISLIDGRTFSLGNLKGEKGEKGDKGDKGDKGERGPAGTNGVDGTNGIDGINGTNGKDGIDAEVGDYKINITYDITVNSDHTCPVTFDETYYYDAGSQINLDIRQKEYTDENKERLYFAFDDDSLTNDYSNFDVGIFVGYDNSFTPTDYMRISGTMPEKDVNIHVDLKQKTKITVKNTLDIEGTVVEIGDEYHYCTPEDDAYFIDDSCMVTGLKAYDDKLFIVKLTKGVETSHIPAIDTVWTREYKSIGCTEAYSNFIKWPLTETWIHVSQNITYEECCNLIKDKIISMGFNGDNITFINKGFTEGYSDYGINIRLYNYDNSYATIKEPMSNFYLDSNRFNINYYYSPDIELYVFIDND